MWKKRLTRGARPMAMLGVASVFSAFVLAGCESQGTEPGPGTAGESAGPSPHEGEGDAAEKPSTGADEQWDPASWEPTVVVTLSRLSEVEREQWRDDHLARLADDLDGPAPEVPLERWVEPNAEWDHAMSECMAESGFVVEVDGGAIRYPGGPPPAEQLSAWDLAWYTCNARFTPDPDYAQDWTEEQIGLVYDYWDQYFIPCMDAHGVTVNRAQQPSRESYVDTFYTSQRTWWPNEYLETLPDSQRDQVEASCPPFPPPEVFYGNLS